MSTSIDIDRIPRDRLTAELRMKVDGELGGGPRGAMGGWWAVKQLGWIATELTARLDGDGGLIVHYDIDFIKPIYGGDWVRFFGEIVKIGNTSRTFDFTVERYIDGSLAQWDDDPDPKYSIVKVMDQPQLVLKGQCVTVVPKPRQRLSLPVTS